MLEAAHNETNNAKVLSLHIHQQPGGRWQVPMTLPDFNSLNHCYLDYAKAMRCMVVRPEGRSLQEHTLRRRRIADEIK